MNRARLAIAIAVVCVACVKVPDDIKATFAPGQGGSETNNFSSRSPHTFAPPELTEATVLVADASADASPTTTAPIGMCPRDEAPTSSASNCLNDAGDQ
jgi:hypothetical protein